MGLPDNRVRTDVKVARSRTTGQVMQVENFSVRCEV